eukprot:Pgem_evm1s20289
MAKKPTNSGGKPWSQNKVELHWNYPGGEEYGGMIERYELGCEPDNTTTNSALAILMMSPSDLKQLEVIQNKAMRLITNTRQVDRIKINTLQNLTALLTIEDRSIALVHKYLNQATTHNTPIIELLHCYYNNAISRNMKEGRAYEQNNSKSPTTLVLIGIMNETTKMKDKKYTKEKIASL